MKVKAKKIVVLAIIISVICTFCSINVFAKSDNTEPATTSKTEVEKKEDNLKGKKAIAAAICVGVASSSAAIGMSLAVAKSSEGISRQPEAAGSIRTGLMLGLVFIETAIIYSLVTAILIIFVL